MARVWRAAPTLSAQTAHVREVELWSAHGRAVLRAENASRYGLLLRNRIGRRAVSGFLSRVSRYARPSLVEQRENRLTEVFAAVLERADGLALHLAKEWLSPDPGLSLIHI